MWKQMGPTVFSFEPTFVAHAVYTALGSARHSSRGEPPELPKRPRDRFFHISVGNQVEPSRQVYVTGDFWWSDVDFLLIQFRQHIRTGFSCQIYG
jgi:hypothetical protein